VLPDRDFVQMPGVPQNKFKLSVACALHLPVQRPKLEHLGLSCGGVTIPGLPFAVDLG
jgi:hypothetical protein